MQNIMKQLKVAAASMLAGVAMAPQAHAFEIPKIMPPNYNGQALAVTCQPGGAHIRFISKDGSTNLEGDFYGMPTVFDRKISKVMHTPPVAGYIAGPVSGIGGRGQIYAMQGWQPDYNTLNMLGASGLLNGYAHTVNEVVAAAGAEYVRQIEDPTSPCYDQAVGPNQAYGPRPGGY